MGKRPGRTKRWRIFFLLRMSALQNPPSGRGGRVRGKGQAVSSMEEEENAEKGDQSLGFCVTADKWQGLGQKNIEKKSIGEEKTDMGLTQTHNQGNFLQDTPRPWEKRKSRARDSTTREKYIGVSMDRSTLLFSDPLTGNPGVGVLRGEK